MRFVSSDSRYFYFPFSSSVLEFKCLYERVLRKFRGQEFSEIFGNLDNLNCNNHLPSLKI